MKYDLGNKQLDTRLQALVSDALSDGHDHAGDAELVGEILVTGLKMLRDHSDRGNLKLANSALKEMRYAFLVFSQYADARKVTIFGSARTKPDEDNYRLARDFASVMADADWMVITGAGPGIMEAGNIGAGMDHSFGVAIRLPFEASPNEHIPDSRLINFKYFFTRKLMFVKESDAFVMLPGGFGTQDEAFELLTLIQTGKTALAPIVLLDAPGSGYWDAWKTFVAKLRDQGMTSPDDEALYVHVNDVEAAHREIDHFYSNYHSMRYVNGRLVLRMQRGPTAEQLQDLNKEFSHLLASGAIEAIETTPAEERDSDWVDLARLRMHYNRRDAGGLRRLVNRINAEG